MVLSNFFSLSGNQVKISRQQASRFAKEIADDFNPLHDTDAKIFCVPGDLLFSVALNRLGLSQHMRFNFSGMVSDNAVIFPDSESSQIDVIDSEGKQYLSILRKGDISHDQALINCFSNRYVTFSGKTFPHILVPLMAQQGVMINPSRPLIIYQSMEINLDRLDLSDPHLESTESSLDVQGRKGTVQLDFCFMEDGVEVGRGTKYMALRGLQPYQDESMQRVVDQYNSYKQTYQIG
ncbi:MAG: DUF3581 domain-containing protein [Candidatus Thiodiazotropha sp. (ex Lucinoma aequizonata)]|nr:DUF3581 domain-containing protein [Candidatus Thiodiazotropha sp. (ex Lucinoma aequizonata)]MCU7888193.1 DUF3581 domain-containing protein [Candidatus Thiodiazotropha sp. (ex Lucinoma aequizonata)]MCU7894702.1 DUF3581 domain-containing protein [Candidatus Thiodiazotropha sp. (ex Lucinoma aequizonata)]MCU7900281.1 DUF3581 domain-containing protein [Candidatus Thiodiazotropha sp. (ex Lucinoma aequizonata)]MCU7903881.1 DUF3581 domain-containing protein [Candidatus Thiodiazotropha sp. (ex Lucino